MSKCKSESRSRQQDQLDLNNIINLMNSIQKFQLRNFFVKQEITSHNLLTIGCVCKNKFCMFDLELQLTDKLIINKESIDDCFYIPHTL